MKSSDKDANFKEKLRQALNSTFKVISDDFISDKKIENKKSSDKFNLFDLENLNTRVDFIKARAETDSNALKKKFSKTLGMHLELPF